MPSPSPPLYPTKLHTYIYIYIYRFMCIYIMYSTREQLTNLLCCDILAGSSMPSPSAPPLPEGMEYYRPDNPQSIQMQSNCQVRPHITAIRVYMCVYLIYMVGVSMMSSACVIDGECVSVCVNIDDIYGWMSYLSVLCVGSSPCLVHRHLLLRHTGTGLSLYVYILCVYIYVYVYIYR